MEYVSLNGFILYGGFSFELVDCDVMIISVLVFVIIFLLEGILCFVYDDFKFELCVN